MKCEQQQQQQAYRIRSDNRTTVINTCVKSVKTKEAIYHNIILLPPYTLCEKYFFLCAYVNVSRSFVLYRLFDRHISQKKIRDRNFTLYILTHTYQRDESTCSSSSKPQQLYQPLAKYISKIEYTLF